MPNATTTTAPTLQFLRGKHDRTKQRTNKRITVVFLENSSKNCDLIFRQPLEIWTHYSMSTSIIYQLKLYPIYRALSLRVWEFWGARRVHKSIFKKSPKLSMLIAPALLQIQTYKFINLTNRVQRSNFLLN